MIFGGFLKNLFALLFSSAEQNLYFVYFGLSEH
jgi:hypothetical protein